MPRPALTLLVIYPHKLVRADFGPGATPELLDVWQQGRPDVDDIGLLVESAATQGPRLRGSVWILWSDLFAHALRLDAKSMGLQARELESALAFEAESLSGISAFESAVAYQQTLADKGEREFWVLQARRGDVEQLRDAVARLGGRLAGLVSPAGMDFPVLGGLDPMNASEEVLNEWLGACAAILLRKKSRPTVIVPAARPYTTAQRWLMALALALPVGLLCLAHDRLVAVPAREQMKSEIKKLQEAADKLKSLDKQVVDAGQHKEELLRHKDDLKKSLTSLDTQRKRLAALLDQMAYHRSEDLILLKIDNSSGDPSVQGFCLRPHAATDFANRVGEMALALGWQVQSPKSEAKSLLPTGGPWSFELQFKDILTVPEITRPTKTAKR